MYNRKIKNLILSLALLPLLAAASFAQFTGDFSQGGSVYDAGDMDVSRGIAVDTFTAGGPYIYTIATSSKGLNNEIEVVKYDSAGSTMTTASWAITGTASISGFAAVNSAGVYVTFQDSGAGGPGVAGYVIIKYDQYLSFVTSAAYITNDAANQAIALDNAGNVFVTGGANGNYTTVKYDANLTEASVASHVLDLNGMDYSYAIDTDKNGNVFVAGYTLQGTLPAVTTYYVTAKYDNALNFISSVTFADAPYIDSNLASMGIAVNKVDGSVYVGGSYGTDIYHALLGLKYDNNLVFQSSAAFPGGGSGIGTAIALDSTGNVYALGRENGGIYDYAFVAKLNPNFVFQSSAASTAVSEHFIGTAIALDPVTGISYVSGIQTPDYTDASLNVRTASFEPLPDAVVQTVSVTATDVSPSSYIVGQQAAALKLSFLASTGSTPLSNIRVHVSPETGYDKVAAIGLYWDQNDNGVFEPGAGDQFLSSAAVTSTYADLPLDAVVDSTPAVIFVSLIPSVSAAGLTVNLQIDDKTAFTVGAAMADQQIYPIASTAKPVQALNPFSGDFNSSADYDGGNMDYGMGVALYGSDVYVVGGSSPTGGLVVRYDLSGNVLSSATYGGVDVLTDVAVNANGVYAVGQGSGTGFVTVKYTPDLASSSTVVLAGDSSARGVALDNTGYVYVVGSNMGEGGSDDYKVVKYSPSLVQQGSPVLFDAGGYDEGRDIAVDNGNVYITGDSLIGGATYFVTAKFDSSLAFINSTAYPGGYVFPYYPSEKLAVNGNTHEVYVAGAIGTENSHSMLTIKYSSDLTPQTTAVFSIGFGYDVATNIALDGAGDVYALGKNQAAGEDFAALIKYSPNLVFISSATREFSYGYFPIGIAIDTVTGYSYVTGDDHGTLGEEPSLTNMRTVRFDPQTGSAPVVVHFAWTDVSPANYTVDQEAAALKIRLYTDSGQTGISSIRVHVNPYGSFDKIASVALYSDTNGNDALDIGTDQQVANASVSADYAYLNIVEGAVTASAPAAFITLTPSSNATGMNVNVGIDSVEDIATGVPVTETQYFPMTSAPKPVQSLGTVPQPVTTLSAITGTAAGTVQLSWNYQEELASGATIYIQYSAISTETWNINNAQIKYVKPNTINPGYDFRLVPVGAKFNSVGANVTPQYYFAVWVHNNAFPSNPASTVSGVQPLSAFSVPATSVSSTAFITQTPNYQNDEYNYMSKIARDTTGYIYAINSITISTNSSDPTAIHVRKYGPQGGVMWTSVFSNGSGSSDYGRSVTVTPAGNVIAVGTVYDNTTSNDIWVRKYSPNGDILWTRTYDYSAWGYSYSDYAYDVKADSNYVYVTGQSAYSVWIGKFNINTGAYVASTRYYNSSNYDSGNAIAIASDGNLIVAGGVNIYDAASGINYGRDIWLGKFNSSDLSQVWVSTYVPALHSSYSTDEINAIKTDSKGNIYAAGYLYTDTGNDIFVAKYDQNGNQMFARTKNGPANGWDKGCGIDLDSIGNIYVTGKLDTWNEGQNIWVGKYNSNGSLLSERNINYQDEVGYDIKVSTTGDMYVGAGMGYQFGIVKLAAETGGTAAQTQLSAAPGAETASVDLTWVFPNPGTFSYRVQYSTFPEVSWSPAAAQISTSATTLDYGTVHEHTVASLPAYIQFDEYSQPVTLPTYYFKVWIGTEPVNAVPVASVPQAPAVYWNSSNSGSVYGGIEQDSALSFNSSQENLSALGRDALGNAYVAYGLGTNWRGFAIVKINPLGRVLFASFYNHPLGGRYLIKKALVAGGDIYLAGSEEVAGAEERAWVGKFNLMGADLWQRRLGLPARGMSAEDIALDGTGLYMAGSDYTGGTYRALLARYNPADGALISSTTYKPASKDHAAAYSLTLDPLGNIYLGGTVGTGSVESMEQDRALWKFTTALGPTPAVEKIYLSSGADTVDTETVYAVTVSSIGVFAAGSSYDHSTGTSGGYNWWLARLDPATLDETWVRSYNSKTDGHDEARGLLYMDGALYAAGFEQTSYNGVNIAVTKYDAVTGTRGWAKIMDGLWNWDNAMATSILPGVNGGFYVNGKFQMWGDGFEGGKPGYARIYEPVTGLLANTGWKPCSVNLSWIADAQLDIGTTFYIQYSTVSAGFSLSTSAAQVSFVTDVNVFSGMFVNRLVAGLEAGRSPATADNMDSPAYYFKLGYMLGGALQTVEGSTRAVANTPGTWWRTDRYPTGSLDMVSLLHGERHPVARDSSGSVYTAGTFAPWGGNSNTAAVRKVNSAGLTQWVKFYADEYASSQPQINGLATDASNNVYAVGRHGYGAVSGGYTPGGSEITSDTAQDILLLKYAPNGSLQWARSYDYARGDDNGYAVTVGGSNIYIAGTVADGSGSKAFIAKLDMNGALVSSATYGPAGRETLFLGLAYDAADGAIFTVGRKFAADYDMVVKAYDTNLAEAAEAVVPDYGYDDTAFAVRVDTISETRAVYVAGAAGDEDSWDAYLAKLSTSCAIAWEKTYNSANENRDEAGGVALDGLGGIYLAGTEYRYDINQGKNLFFRKYNPDGDLIWAQTFNSAGSNDDEGDGITADRDGYVYAAVDTTPQGWTEGTAYYGSGVNGAGYFKYRQFNLVTVNPRLTVVVNGSSGALAGVPVNFLGFNQTGGIDPNAITSTVTNSGGVCYANLPLGRNYFIAVSSHNMVPTIKDQLSDPMGSFFVTLNADTTKQYSLYQRADQVNDPVHVLTINITGGLTAGDYVMGEIYINRTAEKVGYSIIRATAAAGQMRIYNVPPAEYGTYGIALNIPAKNKFQQVYMEDSFPALAVYNVDMTGAMTGTFDVGGSTTPPLLTGMVSDSYGSPLENARVIVDRSVCTGTPPNSFCQEVFRTDNLTDVTGKFAFYSLPYDAELHINVRKAGYESQGKAPFTIPAPAPGTAPVPRFEDFQLAQATYTLTGVLKYNGIPLPNANVWVRGDWMNYNTGYDSYRSGQNGGSGVRSEVGVKTAADGSFTVPGVTDGNARIEASFEGGWRVFNDGGNSETPSDDMRVVISSQGARGPNTPANNQCRAGRVWVINSSGACVTAGSVAFNIVPTGGNSGGRVYGNITFVTTYTVTAAEPLAISTSAPLTVMVQQECDGDCKDLNLGFTSVSGVYTTNKATYSVVLSTGFSYWSRILSSEWARASSIENSINLESTDTYRMDLTVTKSGALSGVLKMPDGTNFRPSYGNQSSTTSYWAGLDIRGVNVDGSYGLQVDDNGEFEFPNLAPGLYDISIYPNGAGFVWSMEALKNVSVSVGKTTQVQLQLQSGLAVKPQIYGLPEISTQSWGYNIIAVKSGEEMNQKKITELFFSQPEYSFEYSTGTGWATKWMTPGQYDFYLLVGASYNPGGDDMYRPQSFQQFANFIGRAKGVAVQKSETNPNIGTRAQPIPINILGSVGQESMSGTVKGSKIFTDADFERIFANFDTEIQPLIPAVMVYDSAGDLRGFTDAMPDQYAIGGFEQGIKNQDKDVVLSTLAAHPLSYFVWGLPPGRYTAVFANPNYPPVAEEISLPADSVHNFDFEARSIAVGTISGVIKSSSTLLPLEGARVYLKHRTVEKVTLTDANGVFSFVNLPPGIYRMEIMRDGYVTVGQKTTLAGSLTGDDSRAFQLYMTPSASVISGKVYLSKFPSPITKAGVEIVAYDETLNVEQPSSYLPKTSVQTNGSGEYEINGVVPGHLYKISAFYSGKLPQTLEVTAEDGTTVVEDITMKDVPPQITIKVKKSGDSDSKLDVIIKSPKELIAIPTCKYNPGQVFSATAAVSLALVPGPGNTFVGQFTMTASQLYYTVKVTAGDGGNKMEKLFVYEQNSKAKTEQYIQEAAMAGGEVQMDKETEEYSGIELDPGALAFSTTTETVDFSNLVGGFFSALPSVRTVKTSKGNLTIDSAIQELMASEVYDMNLDKASANKPFTLTLKYDKENPRALTTSSMKIYQYDSATGEWKEVPGNYTVDPMLGVVSVEVASLDSAYEGSGGATTPLGRKRMKMSAVKNGRYVPNATSTSQNGQFAVFTAKPGTGTSYAGVAFDIYNMPNPFSLKAKNVVISADGGAALAAGAYSTRGTIIKYHLPGNKSGRVKFVIYNLAGEKVRTLDEGSRTGGYVYYSEWDGKNDNNTDCASGVYFMLTYLNGNKLGNKPHKLAIIK